MRDQLQMLIPAFNDHLEMVQEEVGKLDDVIEVGLIMSNQFTPIFSTHCLGVLRFALAPPCGTEKIVNLLGNGMA